MEAVGVVANDPEAGAVVPQSHQMHHPFWQSSSTPQAAPRPQIHDPKGSTNLQARDDLDLMAMSRPPASRTRLRATA
jgi:hypothetical protein